MSKPVQYRPHRGSLAEAMKEVKTFHFFSEFVDFLREDLAQFVAPLEVGKLMINYYGFDDRIGWPTYIVTLDGFGVIGFTDGQFED